MVHLCLAIPSIQCLGCAIFRLPGSGSRSFFTDLLNFFTKDNFKIFCFIFSHIFILQLYEPFRNEDFFLTFFKSSDLGFRSKKLFLQFFVDILPLGSGSVDPHIFANPDPNPGSQNLTIRIRIRILSTANMK